MLMVGSRGGRSRISASKPEARDSEGRGYGGNLQESSQLEFVVAGDESRTVES